MTLGVVPALAGTKEQLDAAKQELARIQAELDRATARWNEAESRLDTTRAEIVDTRIRIGRLEDRVEAIENRLNRRAVIAFTNGPASTIDLLLSSGSFTDFTDRLEFLGSMAQEDGDLILEQEVTREELRRSRDSLLELEQEQAAQAEALREIQQEIDAQLERISDRVADLTAKYREEIAASKELVVLGQTPNPDGSLQVCPVAGPNSFVDSFGWPRDGHSHQGIDLISPAGTPVVAAHPGSVTHSSSSSGGIQAYVYGSGGYTFYAHLSGYSGASGSVGAGTVIGYVGSTGNAGSTNHLHFEWHPGGGAAVNPYQMLLAVC
ncbi:MAG TPA: peptidoglycan DD-metalloendopeptidase family protein [Actinomycetota bacterium]|nr:peptidoglycan DD-metalloendopeptidase family protein [Actinomycetota bacterium]